MLRGVAVLTCPACGSTWDAAARVGAHCPDCGTWTRLRPQPGASQARGPSASVQPSAEGEDAATPEAGSEGAATTSEPATVPSTDEPTPSPSEVPAAEGTDAPPSPPRSESSLEPAVPPLLVRERGVKKREPVQKPAPPTLPRTVKVQEAPKGEPKLSPAIPPEARPRERHSALDVLESRGIWSFKRR